MATGPVRLRDVAEAAGVSVPTASKVLNGGGRVAPATRDRILDAARRLDFRPDALAQFFATGRSRTIGVLTQNAPATFTMPVLVGAVTALGALSMATLVLDGVNADNIRLLQSRRADGLLVIGDGLGRPIASVSAAFEVPVVYAFGLSDSVDDLSFLPDGVMAGRLGAEHLLDAGRRRIVHITAAGDRAADDRLRGLQQVLRERDLTLAAPAMRGTWTRQWGREAAHRVLRDHLDTDAVFCGNDQIADGVIDVLRTAGVRIPEDVAVLGVDNWPGGNPLDDERPLTTIDTRLNDLGAAAARHLVTPDDGGRRTGIVSQPCRLVQGTSTPTPRTASATSTTA